ncbi:hypothetical protein GCM10022247_68490 [Allokutzneria multivorans]|uniref:Uncharacterized protein n=1 Tax=Allokutzneria multivorans TaxID=1142134 RepID=A0ABP7TZP6_9PSEU
MVVFSQNMTTEGLKLCSVMFSSPGANWRFGIVVLLDLSFVAWWNKYPKGIARRLSGNHMTPGLTRGGT